ncbi:hypothetical protein D3C79_877830 [compost metagenome]
MVEQHGDWPERLFHGRDCGFDLLRVGHIGGCEQHVMAGIAQLPSHLGAFAARQVDDTDPRPLCREQLRCGQAAPTRAACNQRDLALETSRHVRLRAAPVAGAALVFIECV